MREIIFRGKPVDRFADFPFLRPDIFSNGWIYGSLVVCGDRYYICTYAECSNRISVNNAFGTMVEIVPDSVGQFTGKYDKNGKRIFEKDVVVAYLDYGPTGPMKAVAIIDFDENGGYEWEYYYTDSIEVVDNVYDSPKWRDTLTRTTDDLRRIT